MPEEPCQCPDCQRFYREHDRLIREFPTLRQQQELNWAALQSFRTLSGRVLEDLQKHQMQCDRGKKQKQKQARLRLHDVLTLPEDFDDHANRAKRKWPAS